MPKVDRTELRLSGDELREIHLALKLRIAALGSTDRRKLMPSQKAALKRQTEICNDLDDEVQKLRGK